MTQAMPGVRRGASGPPKKRTGVNVQGFPYYTTIWVAPAITGSGPYTYTLTAGGLWRGLSYGIGDPMTAGGFPSTYRTATNLETNLVMRGQTNGEDFEVYGLSLCPSPDSDQYIVEQFLANAAVELGREADTKRQNLGPAYPIPGAGGLYGAGHTDHVEPPQNAAFTLRSSVTSGLPGSQNFLPIPQKINWVRGTGPDSTLGIVFTMQNTVTWTRAVRAAGTAITAWTPPTVAGSYGSYAKFLLRLHGTSRSALSSNS